ncbi:uncharacterized protein An02g06290 [Aspergillus niger]|uniref:Contig An02c0180, genomic contig n=2 Tax=Aspergillus niger TaxID=5061 RepID=A2QD96_ASPNC|nr:uncharacterized protein An02g06290 [Aspergillus niger]CAK37678.1 unnamed protein product [Aspergillus niger]
MAMLASCNAIYQEDNVVRSSWGLCDKRPFQEYY